MNQTIHLVLGDSISGVELSWREWAVGMLKPVAALAVVVGAIVMSYLQTLGLEKEMIYSIARPFIQLSIIGFVLEFIFNHDQANIGWIFLASVYIHGNRLDNCTPGSTASLPLHSSLFIPIAGMMVGTAMTVTGVTLKRMREDLRLQQGMIEPALALGTTPRQAPIKEVRRALVVALSPVLNNAKTVGLITLPGAMTGLIMGGASPTEAIQLQIIVMNMLLGASTFSGVIATYLSWPFFFTSTYQLQTKVLREE
ncbi:hypothetical protein R1sor_013974 [Riccia sorocarpa]|uniref:Uncharacterized protein n=1 Tax=Riccia sorocarpa TaxID=122646 RepID=A0ABD3HBT1_9MARC